MAKDVICLLLSIFFRLDDMDTGGRSCDHSTVMSSWFEDNLLCNMDRSRCLFGWVDKICFSVGNAFCDCDAVSCWPVGRMATRWKAGESIYVWTVESHEWTNQWTRFRNPVRQLSQQWCQNRLCHSKIQKDCLKLYWPHRAETARFLLLVAEMILFYCDAVKDEDYSVMLTKLNLTPVWRRYCTSRMIEGNSIK